MPGHALRIDLGGPGQRGRFTDTTYCDMDFPDQGEEDYSTPTAKLVDGFETVLLGAVERRLRADVPVVSSLPLRRRRFQRRRGRWAKGKIRGNPIPAFTIQIKAKGLDETTEAGIVARHVGCDPVIVGVGSDEVLNTYPALIEASEAPVVDTSCTALLLLAKEVHARGIKVALTGEGADEWLGGYPWHKLNRVLSWLDVGGMPISQWIRRWLPGKRPDLLRFPGISSAAPRPPSAATTAGSTSMASWAWPSSGLFVLPHLLEQLADHVPYDDLGLNRERMSRWHPFNRELHLSGRCHLPGLLLNAKGDRVAMMNSVETRYPFLDEEVFALPGPQFPPQLKLRGLRDKRLLRMVAERWLPKEIAHRRKAMFRAPFDSFHLENAPAWVEQLLSPESLRRTGYFDATAVGHWRTAFRGLRAGWAKRTSIEMGLVGVLSTQLWHHTWIEGGLCELPTRAVRQAVVTDPAPVPVPMIDWASGVGQRLRVRSIKESRWDTRLQTPVVRAPTLSAGRPGGGVQRSADRAAVWPVDGPVFHYVIAHRPHRRGHLDGRPFGVERRPRSPDPRHRNGQVAVPAGGLPYGGLLSGFLLLVETGRRHGTVHGHRLTSR